VIRSFAEKRAAAIFRDEPARGVSRDLARRVRIKLVQLHTVGRLDELRVPAGNRLEALRGDRAGQYSIRMNDQWRICFRWDGGDAHEVELVDYH
jgi:toxin HigB-1